MAVGAADENGGVLSGAAALRNIDAVQTAQNIIYGGRLPAFQYPDASMMVTGPENRCAAAEKRLAVTTVGIRQCPAPKRKRP